jgi:deoxyhypusine synthase
LKSLSLGRRTALSSEDEIRLANCIRTMEKWGFGLSRREVIEAVKIFAETNNMKSPFKNNIPGEDWFLKFKSGIIYPSKNRKVCNTLEKRSQIHLVKTTCINLIHNLA